MLHIDLSEAKDMLTAEELSRPACKWPSSSTSMKMRYDGYMFSEDAPEVYNPFSLFKAFTEITGMAARSFLSS